MKEKIFNFLKTKLAGFAGGIQDSFLDGIADAYSKTITDETKIPTDITDVVIEAIKASYAFNQSEIDRRTKEALKTFKAKHGLDENGLPGKKDESKKDDQTKDDKKDSDPNEPSWFKAYREKSEKEIADLKAAHEGIVKSKEQEALLSKFNNHEKIKGKVPSSFLKGRNITIESEDKIDELASLIERDYNTLTQELVDQGIVFSIPPAAGGTGGKEGAEVGKKIAEKHNQQILGAKEQAGVKKIV